MKKRNSKNLHLKKKVISNLNLKGGAEVVNGSDTMCLTCNWCTLRYTNCHNGCTLNINGQDSVYECYDSIQNCPTVNDGANSAHNCADSVQGCHAGNTP